MATGIIPKNLAADVDTLNSKLVTLEQSSITLSSSITDAATRCNYIHYNPATKLVTLSIILTSPSGKIPTANTTIGTVPTKYRPPVIIEGIALVVPTSSTNWIDVRAEACRINTDGTITLGNYIYGPVATKFFSFSIAYFAA